MKAVLDASALLAFMNAERGSDRVAAIIGESIISSVNFSEVIGWLTKRNVPADAILQMLPISGLEVVPFDRELAIEAGLLTKATTAIGLSLGDRACLALAKREKLPAYTADNAWLKASLGIEVQMIR